MRLKRKQNAPIYMDNRGQEYPNLFATVTDANIEMAAKQLTVQWGIFVSEQAYNSGKEPLFSGHYVWRKEARSESYVYDGETIILNYDSFDEIWDDLKFDTEMHILSQTVGLFVANLQDFEGIPWGEHWEAIS